LRAHSSTTLATWSYVGLQISVRHVVVALWFCMPTKAKPSFRVPFAAKPIWRGHGRKCMATGASSPGTGLEHRRPWRGPSLPMGREGQSPVLSSSSLSPPPYANISRLGAFVVPHNLSKVIICQSASSGFPLENQFS
jgi:hypothetical protein